MKVEWQTSGKAFGHHYCKQNLLVHSSTGPGSARPPINFSLTKCGHLKDGGGKDTVTAMLKDPPNGLIGEAWRILLAAATGNQLLPDWAQQYRKKHVALWEGKEPDSDSNPGEATTGPPPVEEPRGLPPGENPDGMETGAEPC